MIYSRLLAEGEVGIEIGRVSVSMSEAEEELASSSSSSQESAMGGALGLREGLAKVGEVERERVLSFEESAGENGGQWG